MPQLSRSVVRLLKISLIVSFLIGCDELPIDKMYSPDTQSNSIWQYSLDKENLDIKYDGVDVSMSEINDMICVYKKDFLELKKFAKRNKCENKKFGPRK